MIKSHNFYFFLLYKSFYKYVRTALGGPVKIPQVRNVLLYIPSIDGNSVRDHTDCANIFAESFSQVFTRDSVVGTPKLDFPRNPAAFTAIEFSEEQQIKLNLRNKNCYFLKKIVM
jgi:hypothetical protein